MNINVMELSTVGKMLCQTTGLISANLGTPFPGLRRQHSIHSRLYIEMAMQRMNQQAFQSQSEVIEEQGAKCLEHHIKGMIRINRRSEIEVDKRITLGTALC